jgi:hypothetical protein
VCNINFVQNSSSQVSGRSTVSLVRKLSMLEAVMCSTLFSCENWVSLLQEYLQFESILMWKNHLFYESTHFRWNGETHVSYWTIQCVRGRIVLHIASVWDELPVERNTVYHSVFSCSRNITFLPNNSIPVNRRSTVSLERKQSMLKH